MKNDLSLNFSLESSVTSKHHHDSVIPLATAIYILQAHERARQGRLNAYFMRQMKNELKIQTKLIDEQKLEDSCLVIQTIWRQKHAEKLFNKKKIENDELLGMV